MEGDVGGGLILDLELQDELLRLVRAQRNGVHRALPRGLDLLALLEVVVAEPAKLVEHEQKVVELDPVVALVVVAPAVAYPRSASSVHGRCCSTKGEGRQSESGYGHDE